MVIVPIHPQAVVPRVVMVIPGNQQARRIGAPAKTTDQCLKPRHRPLQRIAAVHFGGKGPQTLNRFSGDQLAPFGASQVAPVHVDLIAQQHHDIGRFVSNLVPDRLGRNAFGVHAGSENDLRHSSPLKRCNSLA